MNSIILLAAITFTGIYIPPQMQEGDTLYGTSSTVEPYAASGISLKLSKLTGNPGGLDFWVYSKTEWKDRLHVDMPTPEPWMKDITVAFQEPFLFDQVLVRGMNALAPWDGQVLTFTGASYYAMTPEPAGIALILSGLFCIGATFFTRKERFKTGDIVTHKIAGQHFIILRSVLIPWGGYLVRGCVLGRYYRRRFRHFELEASKK